MWVVCKIRLKLNTNTKMWFSVWWFLEKQESALFNVIQSKTKMYHFLQTKGCVGTIPAQDIEVQRKHLDGWGVVTDKQMCGLHGDKLLKTFLIRIFIPMKHHMGIYVGQIIHDQKVAHLPQGMFSCFSGFFETLQGRFQ